MRTVLIVGAGGFLGAVSRYLVAVLVAQVWRAEFPLATLLINVTGSLLLGLLVGALEGRAEPHEELRAFLAVGFLGAYTTFSTFALETHSLGEQNRLWWAVANIVLSLALGLGAVRLGLLFAR